MPIIVTIKDGKPADIIRRDHWPRYYDAIKSGDAVAYVAVGDPVLAEPVHGDQANPKKATGETSLPARPMSELDALRDIPRRYWRVTSGPRLAEMTATQKQAVDDVIATAAAATTEARRTADIIAVATQRAAITRAIADQQLPANHPLPDYPTP
jgi:hypothetical protein